jgi:beta-xylosidase
MAPDGSRLLGEGEIVFDQPERHPTCEGPKFLKRNGYYYIFAPAGGVATGWQLALRSRNVFGPYEEKVVLEQGSTPVNGPHQGGLVDTPIGEQWFVHFQDADVYGRIVHLQPVRWENDWPLMGFDHDGNGVGEPVLQHVKPTVRGAAPEVICPQTSDDFSSQHLGLQWQWQANHRDDWFSLSARPRHLRLNCATDSPNLATMPNLLLQKFPASAFSVDATVALDGSATGVEAGLIVIGKTHAAVALAKHADGHEVRFLVNGDVVERHDVRSDSIRLIVEIADGGRCAFSFTDPAKGVLRIGEAFQATPGHWIGAKVGIYARGDATATPTANHADFSDFTLRARR